MAIGSPRLVVDVTADTRFQSVDRAGARFAAVVKPRLVGPGVDEGLEDRQRVGMPVLAHVAELALDALKGRDRLPAFSYGSEQAGLISQADFARPYSFQTMKSLSQIRWDVDQDVGVKASFANAAVTVLDCVDVSRLTAPLLDPLARKFEE